MSTLFTAVQRLVPQHGLSRLLGRLAAARTPRWLMHWVMRRFIAHYGVDLGEAERPFPEAYESFNAFFTRALRPGVRPLCASGIASPADGAISQCGEISDDRILQAKGRYYSVSALLGAQDARAEVFRGGDFITVYLSPKDYHRVHMPLDGQLTATRYVPGDLFSVNGRTAEAVDRLFARNERLVCFFDTPRGPMAMVLVGAMIVAGIETVWGGVVAPQPRRIQERDFLNPPQPVLLDRGAEMGRFFLGSTVILLFPPGVAAWNPDCEAGALVRQGQQLSA
jgi:phosphatidylserine decarboxylase